MDRRHALVYCRLFTPRSTSILNMRRCVAVLVLALPGCHSAPVAESPGALLRSILDRAKAHDYEGVRPFVYPGSTPYRGITTQDAAVISMKESRGADYTGDFSYSDAALQLIIDQHLH